MLPLLVATGLSVAFGQEAPSPPQPPVPPAPFAVLEVASTGSTVTVAQVYAHTTGVGYTFGTGGGGGYGGGPTVVAATTYGDLCLTPCRVELPAGFVELRFYGDGVRPAVEKFSLKAGETKALRVDPGSAVGAMAATAGATTGVLAAFIGGAILALDATARPSDRIFNLGADVAILGGALALTGLGIWGLKATRTVVTDASPPSMSLSYSGAF